MKTEICTLVVLLLIGCKAADIQYPVGANPCIKIQMNGNLSVSTINNPKAKLDGTLDGAIASTGSCAPNDPTPDLGVTINSASGLKGTLAFTFTKGPDSIVSMDVKYTVIPDQVFKNGDTTPVTMTNVASTALSLETNSYTCTAPQDIMFNKGEGAKNQYEFKMTMSNVQIQAFNLANGKFSPAEDCALAASSEGPTSQPPVTTQPAPTTEPKAPTTQPNAPSSEAPTTEPKAPTTKPQSNDTSSEAPATTKPTPKPSSEAPSNMSSQAPPMTTEPPTTKGETTMIPPTTSMVPQPTTPKAGEPSTNTYMAETKNGTTCLLFKAGIEFKIPYMTAKGESKTATIGVPQQNKTTVTGDCEGANNTESLTLKFYNDWSLKMTFAASDSDFYLSDVDLTANLNAEIIPDINATETMTINQKFGSDQFSASKDGSYKCSADSSVTLKDNVKMDTYNLQYAAFQKNLTDFTDNAISECSSDTSTNSVVPIAVGAALAGLVVIVLIAYLIGRRRSRQSGYEQV